MHAGRCSQPKIKLQICTAQELKEELKEDLRRTESKVEANAKVQLHNLCTFGTRPAQLVACVAATRHLPRQGQGCAEGPFPIHLDVWSRVHGCGQQASVL